MTEWVLIILLVQSSPMPIATFTGPNAMPSCVANGKRIEAAGMFGLRVRVHCERIDR